MYVNELQREPLRLWYRIVPSVKEERKASEEVKTNQRASLVDITSKRSWQLNGKEERKCKRRKRSQSEKQSEKIIQRQPPVDSLALVPSAKTIFDDTRTAEFSCSTPIPSAGSVDNADSESNKIQNWLPKAVFDLDDRALFAKRLQRITEFQPEAKEDSAPTQSAEEPVKTEKLPETPTKVVASPKELAGPLNPLRICVTPPTAGGPEDCEIHDSIGALDLSGSKGDSSTDVSSPVSAGSCRSSASPVGSSTSKVGPHPYFMTPSAVYHHVQQQDPAQSMAALAAAAARPRRSEGDEPKSQQPIWDLFQHIHRPPASAQPASQSLLSLLKSNPLLFRTTTPTNNKKKTGLKIPPNSA